MFSCRITVKQTGLLNCDPTDLPPFFPIQRAYGVCQRGYHHGSQRGEVATHDTGPNSDQFCHYTSKQVQHGNYFSRLIR